MNTYKFIQLGPPPKQPRTSQFCPLSRKNGKKLLGKAEVVSMTKCDQNPNNIDILKQYGVLRWISDWNRNQNKKAYYI